MKNEIIRTVQSMGFSCDACETIQQKDGIQVCRIMSGEQNYVLKHYSGEEQEREIENYRILSRLGVPTIRVIACARDAILLEDIARSEFLRLGEESDQDSAEVAVLIAKWYKKLHKAGYAFVHEFGEAMYDENEVIAPEIIAFIRQKLELKGNPVFDELKSRLPDLKSALSTLNRTLTYNDFHYTNLSVAKDLSSALMFDFNLLGKGYAYADIRNVCSSLGGAAKAAFLSGYGAFDSDEKRVDDVAATLVTLYFACKRAVFPEWGRGSLDEVISGRLLENIRKI